MRRFKRWQRLLPTFRFVSEQNWNSRIIKWHTHTRTPMQCMLIVWARSMGMTYFSGSAPRSATAAHVSSPNGPLRPPKCDFFSVIIIMTSWVFFFGVVTLFSRSFLAAESLHAALQEFKLNLSRWRRWNIHLAEKPSEVKSPLKLRVQTFV